MVWEYTGNRYRMKLYTQKHSADYLVPVKKVTHLTFVFIGKDQSSKMTFPGWRRKTVLDHLTWDIIEQNKERIGGGGGAPCLKKYYVKQKCECESNDDGEGKQTSWFTMGVGVPGKLVVEDMGSIKCKDDDHLFKLAKIINRHNRDKASTICELGKKGWISNTDRLLDPKEPKPDDSDWPNFYIPEEATLDNRPDPPPF